jgi:hypothetical protein
MLSKHRSLHRKRETTEYGGVVSRAGSVTSDRTSLTFIWKGYAGDESAPWMLAVRFFRFSLNRKY